MHSRLHRALQPLKRCVYSMLKAMTWKLKTSIKSILSQETGWIKKDWGGKSSVALVYPNAYELGMGNLAVHTIYELLNRRERIVCERVFLPKDKSPILSMESQRPLCDFDVIAFTISFENDYLGILPILHASQIHHIAEKRDDFAPLIIAGGATPTLNPKPLMRIVDAVVLGEIEAYENDLIELIENWQGKIAALECLSNIDGILTFENIDRAEQVTRRHVKDLNEYHTQTVIHSKEAHFGNMHLIEVERGCPRSCRFCATPVIYGKPRTRSARAVLEMVDCGLVHRKRMGLIGADIMSHPEFIKIGQAIHSKGATFSLSSVRVDAVDDDKAALLFESGHRSIALGIEAGTIRLRRKIGKGISDEGVLKAAAALAKAGITRLRLYYMIGLPEETDDDIRAIAELSVKVFDTVREHAPRAQRSTACDLTIAPFVPKPGTPFAGEGFNSQSELKKKIKVLRRLLGKKKGMSIRVDSLVEAALEHFLANADEQAVQFLENAHKIGSARKALANIDAYKLRC
ncbi:MAG: radical SAM protein [Pseudomonadota bacterium]